MENESLVPGHSTGDYIHMAVNAAIGCLPAGSLASAAFSLIIAPPLEKRRNDFLESIVKRLERLEASKSITVQDLRSNEVFVSVVSQSLQIALRTHAKEKIEALENAVINSATTSSVDSSLSQMFLQLVDRFTEWHIRFLGLFNDPSGWFAKRGRDIPAHALMSSLNRVSCDAFPEIADETNKEFRQLIASDLAASGLFAGSYMANSSQHAVFESHTTEFGKRFLNFIKEQNQA